MRNNAFLCFVAASLAAAGPSLAGVDDVTLTLVPVGGTVVVPGGTVALEVFMTTNIATRHEGGQWDLPCTVSAQPGGSGTLTATGGCTDCDMNGSNTSVDGTAFLFGPAGLSPHAPGTCITTTNPAIGAPPPLVPAGVTRYLGTVNYLVSVDADGSFNVLFQCTDQPGAVCDNVPEAPNTTRYREDVPVAPPAGPLLSLVMVGTTLTIGVGACCDDANGVCSENVGQAACESTGGRFGGDDTLCATIDPPCGPCVEEQELTAPDAEAGDRMGNSVSLDGDTVIVGASAENSSGGSAYVYVFSGGSWTFQQKLTALSTFLFGASVSISGDTAVVGGPQVFFINPGPGEAYVFVRSGGVWTQQQKLTASDAAAGDAFGNSVSVDADTIVVGANGNDDAGSASGSAYVFTRSGTVWSQQQKLTASDAATTDNFGIAVALDGDTAVVGAHLDNTTASDTGSAYVFTRSGTVWSQQQKLTASDAAASDEFGLSVSLSGETILVGAHKDADAGADSGSAYVFTRSGTVWSQQQKLTASDAAGNENFGRSVSVSGDSAVVGAYLDDHPAGADRGSAYAFYRSAGVWAQQQRLTASDAADGDQFGFSVSVNGETVAVAARQDDGAAVDAGSVYVFSCLEPCSPPDCSNHGTCDTGVCSCDTGYTGKGCDQCAPDYYNYPTCTFCQAAITCSGHGTCNVLGGCDCNLGFVGVACDQCGTDFYGYPICTFCQAATTCSGNGTCNGLGGCDCDTEFAGVACDQCAPGHVNYPTCTAAPDPPGPGDDNCIGGTNAGLACAQHSDCPSGFCQLKNRFITAVIPATATGHGLKVTLVNIDANSVATPANYNGTDRWALPPSLNVSDGTSPPFNAANLQCTFLSTNWSAVGPLHMYGDIVVPGSTYDVSTCNPQATCSSALRIGTAKWGDIIAPLNVTNFQDIVSVVTKFQGTQPPPAAPSKTRTKLNEPVNPAPLVNFQDIAANVAAFQGTAYKTKFPTPPVTCP